ncbi:MAG: hypothetical protein JXQ85_03455 [Cognatishimia sp.]|uniref:hypothetical protein n=1 Tax=Cognatishimia sp. TaxID=2211648 RepID=UPI003B8DBDF1
MTKDNVLPQPASMLERELSQETLATIKAIVQDDRAALAEIKAEGPLHIPARQRAGGKPKGRRFFKRQPKSVTDTKVECVKPAIQQSGASAKSAARQATRTDSLWRHLTPRRVALVATLMTFIINPWFLPTVLVVVLFFVTLFALLLGPDRIRRYSEVLWRRYEKRQPAKAAALRVKASKRMDRFQKRLDKLPGSWTRGLHMPQMQSEADQAAAERAYIRRMAHMAREEGQQSFS